MTFVMDLKMLFRIDIHARYIFGEVTLAIITEELIKGMSISLFLLKSASAFPLLLKGKACIKKNCLCNCKVLNCARNCF